MKGRTGSTLSRTKYIKCLKVETSCYRVVLQKFIVTVELLHNQAESDFVQCQTGSAVNLNKLNSIEIELFIRMLYGVWSSLQPDHETNKSPRRMQVSPPTRNDNGNLFAFRRVHCVLVLSFLSEPLLNRLLDCEQSLIFLLSHSRSRA